MFDDHLRGVKDRLLASLADRLAPHVPPAAITLTALAAGLVAAAGAATGGFGWAMVWWAVNRLLDGLDGAVARSGDRQSDLGAYLDILADFMVYALVPIGVVAGTGHQDAWPWLAALLGAYYVNAASWMYLAALLERRGTERGRTAVVMPGGLVGGTETLLLYFVLLALPQHAIPLFQIMTALVGVTVAQRLVWAARGGLG